jgi:hypothetical protein
VAVRVLQNGDRLTRDEFERRYEAMPDLKKAELIKGVVYMPAAAVRFEQHGGPHFDLIGWLAVYRTFTRGVRGGDNSSLRLSLDDEPQPDALLFILPEHGGRARLDDEGYVVSGPELIGEIAASSVSYDLHDKLDVYREHRVQEYIVWRVEDEVIDWFVLKKDSYVPLPLQGGIYRSRVFPGLWLDARAMIEGDMLRVAEVAHEGLTSPEHAAFAALLEKKGKQRNQRKRKQ